MPEFMSVWIASFSNTEVIRMKLGSKYGIDVDELKRHAIANPFLRGYEESNKLHGVRTVILIPMSNHKVIIAWIEPKNLQIHEWKIRTARYLK